MGFPLLAFFLVSHLLVLHSSGSCPSSFDCSRPLDPIKSPFTNYTHPVYGLCNVGCDEPVPKVIWGGKTYPVSDTTQGTITINDPALKTNHCDFFSYIPYFYNTPSVSFTISPNLTIFKCNTSSPELKREAEESFHENHNTYEGCENGYTVYYPRPNYQDPTGGIPDRPNCYPFQLPSVEDTHKSDPSDLFSLLASNFTVEYHLSNECLTCHDDGGQCLRAPREFQCSKKGGKRLPLILGTVIPGVILLPLLILLIFRHREKLRNYISSCTLRRNTSSVLNKH